MMETSCELGDAAMRCNADDCRFRAAREGEVDEVEWPSWCFVFLGGLEGLRKCVTGRKIEDDGEEEEEDEGG